jgi:ferredoxin
MHELMRPTESPAVESDAPKVECASERLTVTFERANLVAEWDPTAHSLLDFAEQSGLSPPFCCRAGVCGTCLSTIKRGAVAYFESPVVEPAPGEILLCCSRPTESVVIDI